VNSFYSKTILEQIVDIQTLWTKATDTPLPPERSIISWIAAFGYAPLEKVVAKIPWRFGDKNPETDHVCRYISNELVAQKNRRDSQVIKGGSQ
jgi:hypothetical protein